MAGLLKRSFFNHQESSKIHGLGHLQFPCIAGSVEMQTVFTVDVILNAFSVHCSYAVLL
jgi:hypothetical protein